jgi:hypothetical protein
VAMVTVRVLVTLVDVYEVVVEVMVVVVFVF